MKNITLKTLFLVAVAEYFFACKKPQTYSDVPSIKFESLTKQKYASGLDSSVIVAISFTDGDGDIGLTSADTLSPYNPGSIYYNDFIVSSFEKKNGIWLEDTLHERPPFSGFSGRMPYLTPDGNNKALKGDISFNLSVVFAGYQNDTIHYNIYIYDRALNKSNVITTSDIVLFTN